MIKAISRGFRSVFYFYYDGFRSMTTGKKLWLIIFIKLFIMFCLLKPFFFQNYLNKRFDTDEAKSKYILDQLTHQE